MTPKEVKRIRVGRVAELPPGTKKLVRTEIENILLVNVGGKFFATSNTCPHAGGYLHYGPLNQDEYIIECPLHYWPFDVRTGELVGLPDTLPEDNLNTYPTVIENEEVFIELPASSPPK